MEECEIWKDIPGYEGLYQVSNLGRVKSLSYNKTKKEKILKIITDSKGYLFVGLCKNGKSKHYAIHRLVSQVFIPNENNLPCINHKDENPKNNHVNNLEWCTYEYNNNYGTKNKRSIETRRKHGCWKPGKITIQATLDNVPIKMWPSIVDAEIDGFSKGHISACCFGKRKSHKGYKWMFFLPPTLPLK